MKVIIAIVAITILESLAIVYGVDGYLLGFAIAAIAGLGGYEVGYRRQKKG